MDLDYILDRSVLIVLAVMGLAAWIWMLTLNAPTSLYVAILVESVVGFFVMFIVYNITIRIYEKFGERFALVFTILLVAMIGLLFTPIKENPVNYYQIHPIYIVLISLILTYPLLALVVYLIFGREKNFVVPEYLSYVPNKSRKPWFVNFVFKGDAQTLDMDGITATILDLHRRGFLKLLEDGKIVVMKNNGELDGYERKVISFIRKYSKDGVFDPKIIRACIYRQRGIISLDPAMASIKTDPELSKKIFFELFNDVSSLFIPGETTAKTYYNQAFPVGKFYGIKLIDLKGRNVFAVTLFFAVASSLTFPDALALCLVLFFQSLICYSTPTQLFGRWRDEYYKEKLEWQAFRRFLENFAMV